MTTKYWCPTCGDLPTVPNPFPWLPGTAHFHGPACPGVPIPVVEPLAVPEVTTWDFPEVVTVTDPDGLHWVASPCSGYKETTTGKKILDVWNEKNCAVGLWSGNEADAINYVAGVRK
jgi:hypothetical protein